MFRAGRSAGGLTRPLVGPVLGFRKRSACAGLQERSARQRASLIVVGLMVLGVLSGAGCYSAAQLQAMQAERAIDIDEELDLLHRCAVTVVEDGDGVLSESAPLRRVRGQWVSEEVSGRVERRQVIVSAVVDPRFGPGTIARHRRERLVSEGVGADDRPTAGDATDRWEPMRSTPEDIEREERIVRAVQVCWREHSRHAR